MMCSTASLQVCLDAGEATDIPARWAAVHALGPPAARAVRQLPPPRRRGHRLGLGPAAVRPRHLPTRDPAAGSAGSRPRPGTGPASRWRRRSSASAATGSWAAPAGLYLRRLDRGRRPRRAAGPHHRRPRLPPEHAVPAGPPPRLPGDPLPRRPARTTTGSTRRARLRPDVVGLVGRRRASRPPNRPVAGGSRPRRHGLEDPSVRTAAAAVVDLGARPWPTSTWPRPPCPPSWTTCPGWSPPRAGGAGMTITPPLSERTPEQLRSPRRRGADPQPGPAAPRSPTRSTTPTSSASTRR